MLTPYQCYRSMSWTTDGDKCEAACGATLSEGRYTLGRLGHYCSEACCDKEEGQGEGADCPSREDFHADG